MPVFSEADLTNLYSPEGSGKLPRRSEISEEFTWNLKDIYETADEWERDFAFIESKFPVYGEYQGKLGESADILAACLKLDEEVGIRLERLHLYAMLLHDSELKEEKGTELHSRIKSLYVKCGAASSFITPELVSLDESYLRSVLKDERFKGYDHFIDNILRKKNHTLSAAEEKLLAMSGDISGVPYDVFTVFTNADMQFPEVEDEQGTRMEMSHGRYYAALYSKDRGYRERAFKAYYKPFIDFSNTLSSMFSGNLKSKVFYAKAKNFGSAKEAALFSNNIPVEVYDNLVKTVNENMAPMHRWADLKRRILKLEKLRPFDSYVGLFESGDVRKYEYKEGVQLVLDSLQVMGGEYIKSLKTAFDNRWIDVYETENKRGGAYSSGTTFGVHPYVLMNYTNLLNDVFTLTHEMGHNMHSYYTGQSQPYIYSDYTIFLAEVASTFNESLLLDYMIEKAKSDEEKLSLIEKYLNNVTTTFYRQTMFAEFEDLVYSRIEKGEALTVPELRKMYGGMYQKYWGPAMQVDTEEEFTWARVPHFYYNFYVYQYATGMAASEALASLVKSEGEPAVKRYLNFLKAGSSKYSIDILKDAGVDMTTDAPVIAIVNKMNRYLDMVEKIV